MKRLILVPLSVALVAALIPARALAKGGDEGGAGLKAEIKGPSLDQPISLTGAGEGSAEMVMRVADTAGLDAALAEIPDPRFNADPMLRKRPKGDLGPRYTITYFIPGSNGEVTRVAQDLYPFAELRPAPYIVPGDTLTYTAPGQPLFGSEKTRGGWYIATSYLKANLVAAGLPENPPTGGGDSGRPWAVIGGLAGAGIVLAVAVLLIRRRGQTRTVTA